MHLFWRISSGAFPMVHHLWCISPGASPLVYLPCCTTSDASPLMHHLQVHLLWCTSSVAPPLVMQATLRSVPDGYALADASFTTLSPGDGMASALVCLLVSCFWRVANRCFVQQPIFLPCVRNIGFFHICQVLKSKVFST